ncbi:MAG TPA: Maf family protein [Candidatus Sulfotelmatobacter sp.]
MIVLASASPRRQELLSSAGISFVVQVAGVDETPLTNESPQSCAERLARNKAWAVFRDRPQDFVLGADTIVVADNALLGKPLDAADAVRMLGTLSGRTHQVITGVCLMKPVANAQGPAAREDIRSETTTVTMGELSDDDIAVYVSTGEPMDKAGAYAIQGLASRWIPRIEGDYSNVVGLPVSLVYRMLREAGAL